MNKHQIPFSLPIGPNLYFINYGTHKCVFFSWNSFQSASKLNIFVLNFQSAWLTFCCSACSEAEGQESESGRQMHFKLYNYREHPV